MLFSGKENVFMCLVAFQKNFRKIFSGVWKRRRKRQTQKNTDKTQKNTDKTQKKPKKKNHQQSTLDWVRRRGASQAPIRRSRSTAQSHEGEIAIFARSQSTSRSREASNAISNRGHRTRARELDADWSSGFVGDHRTRLELGLLPLARTLSLSLSGNTLKGK